MNEAAMTAALDERGLLADARGPGCYGLALDVPDDAGTVWDAHHNARPPEDALDRMAAADRVAYVGASGNVYRRLCDHAGGANRTPAVLEAYDAERVIDVWPHPNPFEREFNRAMRLVQDGWVVWTDGQLLG